MKKARPSIPQTAEIVSLVSALLVVLLIAGLAFRAWSQFNRQTEQLATATRVTGDTNALLSSLKDAETGQRGFLLTADELYLNPYRQALIDIPVTLNALKTSVAPQPDQAQRLDRLQPLVNEKLAELANTISLRRTSGTAAALAIVRTDRGKVLMDQIRDLCGEIQTVANRRLILQSESSRASANELGSIATIGSAALFVLLGIATTTVRHGTQRRQQLIPLRQGPKQRISFFHQGLDLFLELEDATDRSQRHSLIGELGDVLDGRYLHARVAPLPAGGPGRPDDPELVEAAQEGLLYLEHLGDLPDGEQRQVLVLKRLHGHTLQHRGQPGKLARAALVQPAIGPG